MRVGINAYEANVQNRVGSNVYAFRILCELEKISSSRDDFLIYLPSEPLPDMPPERPGWTYRILRPSSLWTQWRLPIGIIADHIKKPFDVFYSLGHYAPRWIPCPSVVSIMDLAFLRYPNFFRSKDSYKLTSWTKYSVCQSAGVVVISEATKKDVTSFYGVPGSKIVVAYPGAESIPASHDNNEQQLLKDLGIQEPYIVYIGTLQPRKNIERLIRAFSIVRQSHPRLHLILAGKIGWMADSILKEIDQSSSKEFIRQLGFVSDAQKWALLRQAKVSALIGLYEGFGIPALESLQVGTPVVVANTASLPEVVGSCGWQVDPSNEQEIANALRKAVELTGADRIAWQKKATHQVELFSWSKSGKKVWEFLQDVGRRSS